MQILLVSSCILPVDTVYDDTHAIAQYNAYRLGLLITSSENLIAVPTTVETAKQTGGNVDSHDPPVCCGGQTSVLAENRDISKQHIHADEKLCKLLN